MRTYIRKGKGSEEQWINNRIRYLSISFDPKVNKYILVDDYLTEAMFLIIKNNDYVLYENHSNDNSRYRRLIKKFLIQEKLIKEE